MLGEEGQAVNVATLPSWLTALTVADGDGQEISIATQAEQERESAASDANIARLVLIAIVVFFIFLYILADIACRNRIGRMIRQAEEAGVSWGTEP